MLAGDDEIGRPVRWVHSSELEDPTPWLKGGELILTTGMNIGETAAKQRAYVDRLVGAGVAGLGIGLGFGHDRAPKAIVTEAQKLAFPLFEVPYPVPFIAITEAVFTRLLAEQFDTLQRAVDAEHVLTRAVLDGSGVQGIADSLSEVLGDGRCCWICTGCRWPPRGARRRGARNGCGTRSGARGPRTGGSRSRSSTGGTTSGSSRWARRGASRRSWRWASPSSPATWTGSWPGHALSLFAIEIAKTPGRGRGRAPSAGRLLRAARAR